MAKDPNQKSLGTIFTRGIIAENPVLRLILGTCPTLAVSTGAFNALGMGAAATVVLICSNIVISALRNVIPDKVRIPAYITIIAGFVTIIQMLVKGFLPSLDSALGVYLPLIVVNCIILGRAEMFASKNRVLASAVDGLGMGVGFTAALLAMGIIREILGAGSIFGLELYTRWGIPSMIIFILPAGGFFVYGMLIALVNQITRKKNPKATIIEEFSCAKCPMHDSCTKVEQKECEK
ncbi:MAG: electron transport complex subunit E [Oscillospiraceae bacterium]|nr:electron transport complex subunit E [Oscillospiraceae bacterium]